ncbi:MAG: hypothetical protein AAFO82_23960, partial [Bacteroidota bacterium]
DIEGYWDNHAFHEKKADFTDFLRINAPAAYKKNFDYLTIDPMLYALFNNNMEQVKARFAAAVEDPEEAIDNSLRTVFNILAVDRTYKDYTKTVAETVRVPLQESTKLIGDASFNYAAFIYANHLEAVFTKIQNGEIIDWDHFTNEVEKIEFKFFPELKELPNLNIAIDYEQFHKTSKYRNNILNQISVDFFYYAFSIQNLPVYWAFRSWFNLREYLLDHEDAPRRKSWFTFTPNMLDKMGDRLYGFLGENKAEMVITSFTLPYIYDFFLDRGHIDEPTYDRLAEYLDFNRRAIFNVLGNDLWKYKGLYTWKKPNFIPTERYQQEKELVEQTIQLDHKKASNIIKNFMDTLPALSKDAEPPIEPSPF